MPLLILARRVARAGALCALLAAPLGHAQNAVGNGAEPLVRIQPLSSVALQPRREAPAALVARNEARVASQVSGTVLRWTVDAGATVARGALLAEIDARDYQLARDRARLAVQSSLARLALARTQLQRATELVAQGFFSQEALAARETEVQLLQSELAQQQAQLAAAELALGRTRITAPFDATVRERLAQTGELVSPGTVLYVLTESGAAEVSAQLAPADVESLRASAAITFEALGRSLPVRVARVAGTLSAPARTVEVRLIPLQDPADLGLRPGSDGRVAWADQRPHLPASLLVQREGGLGVFTVREGLARFVPVPQAQEGRAVRVDLPEDTPIVVRGQAALRDGQRVDATSASAR